MWQVTHPSILLLALTLFAATAYDTLDPGSPHLLQAMDLSAHTYAASLPLSWRSLVAEQMLSSAFILLGLGGWVGCTVMAATASRDPRHALVLAMSWLLLLLLGACTRMCMKKCNHDA